MVVLVDCQGCKYKGTTKDCNLSCANKDAPIRTRLTNADKIRAMSDEELAEWASAITHDEFGDKKDWLEWPKKEVDE